MPLSGLRGIIAERMAASAHTAARVTLVSEVDATAFVEVRTRLKEMEGNGLVEKVNGSSGKHAQYVTTPVADELEPIIRNLAEWAHRNIDCNVSLQALDARLLMWKIRGKIDLLHVITLKTFCRESHSI